MKRDSPIAVSFVFGLVGGILILLVSLIYLPYLFSPYYGGPFFLGGFGFVLGLVSGVLVIVGASFGFFRPNQGIVWGIVTVVFGALSIFSLGGFFVGMALSITGGAIAIVVGAGSGIVREPIRQRACTSCGMFLSVEFAHCPYCGHAVAQLPR